MKRSAGTNAHGQGRTKEGSRRVAGVAEKFPPQVQ